MTVALLELSKTDSVVVTRVNNNAKVLKAAFLGPHEERRGSVGGNDGLIPAEIRAGKRLQHADIRVAANGDKRVDAQLTQRQIKIGL